MGRLKTVIHGREFRDTFLEIMATRFPRSAVERKCKAWDWLFAAPASTAERPTRVFAVEENGLPVGAFIFLPCHYVIGGRHSVALQPMATVVRPDHKGPGPIMLKAQLYVGDGQFTIGVANSGRLSSVYARRFDGLLSPPRILRRRIHRPGSILMARGRMPASVGRAMDHAARGPLALAGCVRARLRGDELVEPVSEFGHEFDEAWDAAADTVALAQTRSSAFLNWRYKDMPLTRYDSLALRRRGRLAGYAVISVQGAGGVRVGRIADIFACSGTERDYGLLLSAADARLRRAGCAYSELSFGRVPAIDAAARSTGFLFRKEIEPLVMRHDTPEVNRQLPELVEHVHFCRGDHDEDY